MSTITAIIPCHNVARYIGEALKSVAGQSHRADRIVIVDDASDDGSIEIARKTGVEFDCIRIEKRNLAAARNAGVNAAKTEWIAFLDGDDFWLPGHLLEAMRLLKLSDAVAFRSAFTVVDDSGVALPTQPDFLLTEDHAAMSHDAFFELAARGFPNSSNTYVIRRDRYLDAGGSREKFVRRQDIDMWVRCIEGHRWAFSRAANSCYRVDRSGSLSQNVAERNRYELQVWLDARSRLGATDAIKTLIECAAWRTASTAATQGAEADHAIARQIALPELRRWKYGIGRAALAMPGLVRLLNRARR